MPKKSHIIFGLISAAFLFSFAAGATVGDFSKASLSLSPASGNYKAGDTFVVGVYLNSNGNNIVVAGAYFKYDKKYFQAISIDTANSIFSLEAEKIINSSEGRIKIVRGSPTPGVLTSNGLVANITFKALADVTPGSDNFVFDFVSGATSNDSDAILDDGLGTDILTAVNNAKISVGSGGPVSFLDGTLIRAAGGTKIYYVENSLKRWIPTAEIFNSNGYDWNSVLEVPKANFDALSFGTDVAADSDSVPEGALIRVTGGIDIYIVKYAGSKKFKRLILSPSVFNSYQHLKWGNVKDVSSATLNSFETSELVRAVGDTKVYKLYPGGDTGEKRWVKTADAFLGMGFDWDAIYEINQVDRDSYITGLDLE